MKKFLSIILSILMVVTMIPMSVLPASATEASDSVSYVDYTWNEESKTLSSETKSVDTYTEIASTTTEMTSGWYVVNGEVTVAERMTATGEVHLILADGAHLTASLGITVNEGNSLYIYGQSSDESTMGKLTATTTTSYDAAIGSLKANHAGNIVINGGNINASASASGDGAAIGSAGSRGGYQITINAGVVTATSGNSSAAIGSGNNGGYDVRGTVHSICINGGVVNATVTANGGAAIGGGSSFDGGDITITGGTVTATNEGAGAAIGGGMYGSGGNITITGGNVSATYTHSFRYGVAIGAGYYGESAGNILITGGTVTATSNRGCGIGAYNGDNGRIVILGGTVNASGSGTVHIKAGASGSMMLVDGTTVTISGDFTLQTDFVLPEGYTLEISEGATLTIPEGVTLTLPEEYTLVSNGTVNAVGTVNCITHKYVEGVCICGLECSHVGGTPTCTAPAVCTICGTGYGEVDSTNHNWENGVCTYGCNTNHEPHDWSGKDGICTVCGATCTHTGGEATCTEQAKCKHCGASYGELDPDNHEYENGFCLLCNSYEKPAIEPGEYDDETWDDTYLISNAGQLYWLAEYVNNVNNEAHAALTADITVPETAPNWVPIGGYYQWTPYTGYFDGRMHTISGLKCETEGYYAGLFGYTDYGNEIKNVGVINSSFKGIDNVGGLIGSSYSYVKNCYVADTTVEGTEYDIGTLIGYNGNEVSNCYTDGGTLIGGDSGITANSYYLSETETEDGGKTEAQFASGEVAYLLQNGVSGEDVYDDEGNYIETVVPHIWGQKIDTDTYPVLGGDKVYQVSDCKNAEAYSNVDKDLGHNYVNGICTVCDEVCGHTGGTATCTEKAVCEICGEKYGETLAHTDEDSNEFCDVCGKLINAKVLTSVGGYLYIDGVKAETTGSRQDLPSGKYVLTGDISTYWTIREVAGESITLDLNGYVWNMGSSHLLLNGAFSLYDTSENETGKIVSSWNGTTIDLNNEACEFNLYGGTVENTSEDTAAKALASRYGTTNLYGGKLKGKAYAMTCIENNGGKVNLEGASLECGEDFAHINMLINDTSSPAILDVTGYTGEAFDVEVNTNTVGKFEIIEGITNAEEAEKYQIRFSSYDDELFLTKTEYDEETGAKYAYIEHNAFTQQATADNNYTVTFNNPAATFQWYEIESEDLGTYSVETERPLFTYEVKAGSIITVSTDSELEYIRILGIGGDEVWLNGTDKSVNVKFDSDTTINVHSSIQSPRTAIELKFSVVNETLLDGETGETLQKPECGKTYWCKATEGSIVYTSDAVTVAHTGGTATCTAKAVCDVCGKSYGEVDADAHNWANLDGICANGCGATCVHENQTGDTCSVCGATIRFATITGVSINVDGVIYTSDNTSAENPAVINPDSVVTVTVTGENFDLLPAGPENAVIGFTYFGHNLECLYNNPSKFDIDTVNNTVSFPANYNVLSKAITASELTYTNDDWHTDIGSGVYVIYIDKKDIADTLITLDNTEFIYSGNPIEPTVLVMADSQALMEGEHYTLTFESNVNAGTASVTVKGIGDYTGEVTKDFTITKAYYDLTAPTPNTLTYKGEDQYLVSAGTVEGAYFEYSLDGASWSTSIPQAKDVGNYTVYYRVLADENHYGIEGTVDVTIKECPHEWNDGVLTRPVYDAVLGSKDGYYTYTCTLCCEEKTEAVKSADYSAYEAVSEEINVLLQSDELTDAARQAIYSAANECGHLSNDLTESEQNIVDDLVAELEKIVADAEEKIASGEYVKIDGIKEYNKIAGALDAELMENYSQEEIAALAEKAGDEINARLDEIIEKAEALTGSVAENKDALAEIESEMKVLYGEIKNCLDGVHNGFVYEVTEEAKCEVNAIESATCTLCGETDEREVEGSALEHSFTKYEVTEEAKCGVEGKEISYCDNGCGATDEKEIPALEHIDEDGDYLCDHGCGHEFEKPAEPDTPDTPDEPTDEACDHLCHKDGLLGFFWKIACFFFRLFNIQQYCDCGELHYEKAIIG